MTTLNENHEGNLNPYQMTMRTLKAFNFEPILEKVKFTMTDTLILEDFCVGVRVMCKIWGGCKALTMTMTPWNLPHGQWSKKLTMTMKLSIGPWSMVKIDQF